MAQSFHPLSGRGDCKVGFFKICKQHEVVSIPFRGEVIVKDYKAGSRHQGAITGVSIPFRGEVIVKSSLLETLPGEGLKPLNRHHFFECQ